MAQQPKPMTTAAFAKATGIPPAAVAKLIREGRIKARKEGKAWMIPPSQLGAKAVREWAKPSKPGKGKAPARAAARPKAAKAPAPAPEPPPAEKTFAIEEFAAMTYLTERGVAEWLKSGRLRGVQTESGEWRVLESNLTVADISRLVRK